MDKKRVLLGMSGGVDSSVSAILLKNQGYDVIGVTMKLWDDENDKGSCCSLSSTMDAKRVCDAIGIPHYTVNFKDEFKEHVINDFINCYSNCKTPNPCIECNKYLKFGSMYKLAKELNADYIATGHYARTEFSEKYNRYVLSKAASVKKDQSYFLYSIPSDLLDKIIFPLADFESKDEIRKIAKEYNLPVANKPDSEDICFVPDGDYKKFLEEYSDLKENEGNIVNISGKVLGKHKGLHRYTIGQRRGLGISNKVPLFVTKLDSNNNNVVVGEEQDLYSKEILAEDINLLLFDEIVEPIQVFTKIRYAAKPVLSTIYKVEENRLKVVFEEPQRGATPGQAAVFYIDDIVMGGGKIT